MGFFDEITGGLFGSEPEAGSNTSGIGELIKYFPQFQELGGDAIRRALGLAGETSPFKPAALTDFDRAAMGPIGPPGGFKFGQRASDAYGGISQFLQSSFDNTLRGSSALTSPEIAASTADFYNPFEANVISGLKSDLLEDRGQQLNYAKGMASNNNAFGGTRQAALEGDIMATTGENMGRTIGDFRYAGHKDASDKGLTRLLEDRGRALTGAGLNLGQAQEQRAMADSLMNARSTMEGMRTESANRNLGIGDFLRGRETQEAQIPLQQLEVLMAMLGAFPASGSGTTGTPESKGLVGRLGETFSPMRR